ncbi:hypothetical protein, partial [Carbonactinospora thermoautotrophica]|uniref:hypothetical protein n=1 Tax=Carbonactinospora thermoautotrophica TaxID=1469144 RepID=UPI000B20CC77
RFPPVPDDLFPPGFTVDGQPVMPAGTRTALRDRELVRGSHPAMDRRLVTGGRVGRPAGLVTGP